MKTVEVNDTSFLRETLRDQIVERVRYLVGAGIAYDSNWRQAFVETFQVLDQLDVPSGDKLDPEECTCEDTLKEDRIIMKGSQVVYKDDRELVWTVLDVSKGFVYLSRAHVGNPLGIVTRTALFNELVLL